MSHWSVVIKPPKDPKNKIQMDYVPALIFFECDSTVKGIAAFSDQGSAQMFREQVAQLCSFEVLCIPLGSADDVRAWCDILFRYLGIKLYDTLPIYLDPPDTYCKEVKIPSKHKNLWTFITECMPEDMHPLLGDVAGFEQINGCYATVLRDQKMKQYVALVCMDRDKKFTSGVQMISSYLEVNGTTAQWKMSKPSETIVRATADAREIVKKIGGDK